MHRIRREILDDVGEAEADQPLGPLEKDRDRTGRLAFFEEIAKFRAARRIWARYLKDKYRAKNPKSLMLRTHAQTAGVSLTAQQPHNNIVRVAVQAMAGILGGVQSLASAAASWSSFSSSESARSR